jgi:hypothetical protein
MFSQAAWQAVFKPGIPEEGVPGRWRNHNRLYIITEDKFRSVPAIKHEKKGMLRMGSSDSLQILKNEPTDTFQFIL